MSIIFITISFISLCIVTSNIGNAKGMPLISRAKLAPGSHFGSSGSSGTCPWLGAAISLLFCLCFVVYCLWWASFVGCMVLSVGVRSFVLCFLWYLRGLQVCWCIFCLIPFLCCLWMILIGAFGVSMRVLALFLICSMPKVFGTLVVSSLVG